MKGVGWFNRVDNYNLEVISTSKGPEFSISSSINQKVIPRHHQTETKTSCTKYRHIVAVLGFGVFSFLYMHRMNMTVSIVAMVNTTAIHQQNQSASQSCVAPEIEERKPFSPKAREAEFEWTPVIEGYILSSSFIGYCIMQALSGKVAERYGCKWLIFGGAVLSSLCTFLTPFAAWFNLYALISVQAIRGMAQGTFQPSLSVLIANWFPKTERGCLSTFMMSGQCFGAFFGGTFTGILCDSIVFGGWPSVFYIFGIAGAILSTVIAIFLYENPNVHPYISQAELKFIISNQENALTQRRPSPPWKHIFTSKPFYALCAGFFGSFWVGTHFLAVHPIYLGTILHYSMEENGLLSSLPFIFQMICAITASMISSYLNRKGYMGVDKVRKMWNTIMCFGYSLCLVGIYLAKCNKFLNVIFSMAALGLTGLSFAGCLIVPADMSPTFAGSLMGIACTFGTTSSFIFPLLVGFITDGQQTLEQWDKVLFISIGVVMTTGIIFQVFGSAAVQPWNFVEENQETDEKEKERY